MKTTTVAALITATLVAFSGAPCLAGGIRIGDTMAARIAKDTSIPGKRKAGQCLPFAMALQKKLAAAGIPSRVVVFGYEADGVPTEEASAQPVLGTTGSRGSHAVVVYDDGGRTYVMDNQSWTPNWVHSGTPVQMAQQFSGIQCSVRVARVVNREKAPEARAVPVSGTRLAIN